jgi:hypothetical protein
VRPIPFFEPLPVTIATLFSNSNMFFLPLIIF